MGISRKEYYSDYVIPESKKTICRICDLTDNTGSFYPSDMNFNIHKGFTIGTGKTLYWNILWHRSGHCTVYSIRDEVPRYIKGDQEITLHFH